MMLGTTPAYSDLTAYYQLVLEEVSWADAVETSQERGGNLATVTSQAEWDQINEQLGTSIDGLDLWLGGRADPEDTEQDPGKRRWIWVTGEEWDYSRWRRLEPDGNFGVQDRLFINGSHPSEGADHKWNDHPNKAVDLAFSKYEIKGYIIELGWASIDGNLRYVGSKSGNLYISVTGGPADHPGGSRMMRQPGDFSFTNLVKGFEYTIIAYLDTNSNQNQDEGEPEGRYVYTPHLLTEDLKDITVTVYDENSPPNPLVLNGQSIHDNDEVGKEIGIVIPSDPDEGQELMVYVIDPTHKFRVDGNKLLITTTFNSEEIQSQPLVLRTVDDGGLFTDTQFNLSVLPPNRSPTINTRESVTIDEDSFFRMATSGENILQFDDDATGNEQVEVTFTVTEGGIYFFKNNNITFTDGEPGTGYVKFRGTLDNVNARMDRLTYNPPEDFNGQVTWTIEISDLGNHEGSVPLTASHTIDITINAVNDAPEVTVPEAIQNLLEDSTLTFNIIKGNPITVNDDPENDQPITFEMSVDHGTLTLGKIRNLTFLTGADESSHMEISATTTALNSALNGLTYTAPRDFDGTATISFLTADNGNIGKGGPKTAQNSLDVSILAVNDAPIITGPSLVTPVEDIPFSFDGEADALITIIDDAANEGDDNQVGNVTTQLTINVDHGTVRMGRLNGLTFLEGDSAGDSKLVMTGPYNLMVLSLDGMTYTSDKDYNGGDSLKVEFNDLGHFGEGGAKTAAHTVLLVVGPANDPPTDVLIDSSSVAENKKAGTSVGKLSAVDPDANDTHTFKLVVPADAGAPPFTISGNTLKTTRELDAEDEPLILVHIAATDKAGATFTKTLWIHVTNLNDAPTGINIDNSVIPEEEPAGTFVGTLTTIDSDGTLGRGLIGYWPFDDGQGISVADYSGNGNGGTINNETPTMWKPGKIGTALELNGSTRLVEIPHIHKYLIDSGTFSIWYKHTNDQGALFSKDSSGFDNGGHFYLTMNAKKLAVRLQGINTHNNLSMNAASSVLNTRSQWHHAAFTFGTSGMTLYLDGEIMSTNTHYTGGLGQSSGGSGNAEPIAIGANTLQSGDNTLFPAKEYFKGSVDEFRIYDRALSDIEVLELMETTTTTNDFHVYTLVPGVGAGDNSSFSIDDNQLFTKVPLDHEGRDGYHIRIRTQDSAGETFEQSLHITTTNVNDPPSDIILTPDAFTENQVVGATVGLLSAMDDGGIEEGVGSYQIVNTAMDWEQANANAEALGGHLAIITSEAEWQKVMELPGLKQGLFIGATDEEEEGTWRWVNGQPLAGENRQPDTFHAWLGSEPNNTGDAEHYAVIWEWDQAYAWNDTGNSSTGHIVEFPGISYQLVEGEGDTDNSLFTIEGNELKAASGFNFETRSAHSIRVKATDSGGLSLEKAISVTITDANDTPVGITIDNNTIDEGLAKGATVGNLSAIDEDAGDTHTFSLVVPADGGAPPFTISGKTLKTTAVLDFESQPTHELMVMVTDEAQASFSQVITINVNDTNDPPTGITLAPAEVAEGLPRDTVIGTLTAIDTDPGDTHTFRITGGADKSLFNISGNQLFTREVLDYETKAQLEVTIEARDESNLTFEQTLTVNVINANDPPTDITLEPTTFAENLAIGTDVSKLALVDPDGNDAGNENPTTSAKYVLVNKTLTWKEAKAEAESMGGHLATFNSEQEWDAMVAEVGLTNISNDNIWLGATDEVEEGVWKWVTGEPVTYNRWDEGQPDGKTNQHYMLIWAATGARWDDMELNGYGNVALRYFLLELPSTPSFTLTSGSGDTDNSLFTIEGDQLKTAADFNYEARDEYTIRVKGTDSGGLSIEKTFTLDLTNAPDAPTDILLSESTVDENLKKGTLVGNLVATDEDAGEKHTFKMFNATLVANPDNALFTISGNQLKTNDIFDFETKSSYTINVEVTDDDDLVFMKELTIGVNDINDAPTGLTLAPAEVAEDLPRDTVVGTLTADDPDAEATHTFRLIGGDDKALFNISGNQLTTKAVLDYEAKPRLEVIIEAKDNGNLTFEQTLVINVINVNDPPTDIILDNDTFAENQVVGTTVGLLSAMDDGGIEEGVGSYQIVNTPMNWEQANANAEALGGHLAIITSEAEWEKIKELPGLKQGLFIGATDEEEEGTWKWVDGQPLAGMNRQPDTFHAWRSTDPNNSDDIEHYAVIWYDDRDQVYSWVDFPNSTGHIVEFPGITYQLVAGNGDTDNALFIIQGDQLNTAAAFNYEARDEYTIRVKGTDSGGLSIEKVFTLDLTDAPDVPTEILLSNSTVDENEKKGAIVGNLGATDEDADEKHTFRLLDIPVDPDPNQPAPAPSDNSFFAISGTTLKTNAVLDFEAKSAYTITIEVTDKDKRTYQQEIVVGVNDANDAPTGLTIDRDAVAEGLPKGTEVGTLLAQDPDAGDSHTFRITGGKDYKLFSIVDNKLLTKEVFDREVKAAFEVEVTATDSGRLIAETLFNITVIDVNDAPTDVTLDNDTIAENQPADSIVGNFTLVDQDGGGDPTTGGLSETGGVNPGTGGSTSFTLAEGAGDTDNASFTIDGERLKIVAPLNFEAKPQHTIRVKATDAGGLSVERNFLVKVTNVPEAPVAIAISNDSIAENLKKGATIGKLSATDEDAGEKHTFKLIDSPAGVGNDNALFSISGYNLRTNAVLDFDATPQLSVLVEVTDRAKLTYTQVLTINVTDANDAPTGLTIDPVTIAENQAKGTEIGTLTAIDPDTGDTHTYSVVGGKDKKLFAVNGDKLITNAILDYELKSELDLVIRVTDSGKASVDIPLPITVTDVNDGPTDITLDNDTIAENQPADTVVGKLALEDPDGAGGGSAPVIITEGVGEKLWEFETGDYVYSSPAIGIDGLVYFGSFDRKIYALVGQTGIKKWEYETGGQVESSIAIGSDGTVYVGSNGGSVYALDGQTGSKKWEFVTGGLVRSSPAIGPDGTVYIGSFDNKVYALNGKTGSKKWEFVTGGSVKSSPVIGSDGMVYIGSYDKRIYALDGETGEKQWEFITGGRVQRSPSIGSDGTVYVGSFDNIIYALNGKTGVKKWAFEAGDMLESSPAIGSDGIVYVGSADKNVYALDGHTGVKLWEFMSGGKVISSPAVGSDGTVYVGSVDKKVYALDGKTGAKQWEFVTGNSIKLSSPTIGSDGTVYIGSHDNKVYAIQGSSGPANSTWPMFGQNPQHTSRIDDSSSGFSSFTLTAGSGDTDNSSFTIDGDDLKLAAPLNYEAKSKYSIRVKGTDSGGLSIEKEFLIDATNVPEAPTAVVLDNDTVEENLKKGSTVGRLSTTDEDSGEKHTYKLVDAPEGETNQNARFTISGTTLRTNDVFDFDVVQEQTVHVEVTDRGKLTFVQALTIRIIDANDPPTGLTIASDSVDENQPKGTVIGALTAVDPDAVDSHTYSIVGGRDKKLFAVADGNLVSTMPYDFETQPTLEVVVRVYDKRKAQGEFPLSITVNDVNDVPTDITLSNDTIAENEPTDTIIGKLVLLDSDGAGGPTVDPVSGNTQFDFTNGLVAYYPFNGDAKDETGNGHDGVVHGASLGPDRQGTDTSSYYFDGVDDYIDVGSHQLDGAFTIASWVYHDGVNTLPWFEAVYATANVDIGLFAHLLEGSMFSRLHVGGNNDAYIDTDKMTVPTGNWYHLVGSWDGQNASLYIDGTAKATALTGSMNAPVPSNSYLGKNGWRENEEELGEHLKGRLDDVRVYGRALSVEEVTALYNLESGTSTGTTSFALTAGDGDTDNSFFTIDGDDLKLVPSADFETKNEYSVRIKGTDSGGLSIENIFQVGVTDVNEAPFNATLDITLVEENAPAGFRLGKLVALDPDRGDKVVVTLAEDTDEIDNEHFQFKGTSLVTKTAFDYDTQPTRTLRVIATDSGGLNTVTDILINIGNKSEPPTGITLDGTSGEVVSVEENAATDTLVGSFTTEDPDGAEAFVYSLVSGDGDIGNKNFTIDAEGNIKVKASANLDFETSPATSVRVRTTDTGGNSLEISFAIAITNVNELPLGVTLDNESVMEGLPNDTLVGTLSATDTDSGDSHTFTLVDGAGGTHNDLFKIVGDELQVAQLISGKTTPVASILVRVTDAGGLTFNQALSITITDAPDAPTGINLDGNSIKKYERTGTLIGTLTAVDGDEDDSHTFALVSGAAGTNNELFFIDGDQLVSNHMFDDTAAASYKINVEVTDSADLTFVKTFTITIINAANPGGHLVDVTKIPVDGGLVAGAGYYTDGEAVSLVVKNSPGYTFSGHSGDVAGGFSAENPLEFDADGNKDIITSFTQGYHKVVVGVTPERHGYAWGGGSIQHGTEITVQAKELDPKYGCVFTHWSINGVDQPVDESSPLVLKVTVDRTLRVLAHFDYGLPDSMKLVPSGNFSQGDARYHGEKPVITPLVSAFYMDEHETSKKDFYDVFNWSIQQETPYSFMFDPTVVNGRNRAHIDGGYKDDFPITAITWLDAIAFANALSEMEELTPVYYEDAARTTVFRGRKRDKNADAGNEESHLGQKIYESNVDWRAKGYRLPTESEWEKAARGGVAGLTYANSNTLDSKFTHYDQDTIIRSLRSVGSLEPNGFGLYDMNGNAWEMCWDWHWKNWYFEADASAKDPKGPDMSDKTIFDKVNAENWLVRTVRGGSGNTDKSRMRISYRKDFNKTWYQYAITVRPLVPAPSDPRAEVIVALVPAHLGSVTGGGVYEIGATATLIATPASANANFLRWEDAAGNNLGTGTTLLLSLNSTGADDDLDKEITAIFEDTSNPDDQLYSLEVVADPFGSGTVLGGGAYKLGAEVTLTAVPSNGNDFAGWSGDASGTETETKITMDGHKKVLAYFGDTSEDSDEDGLSDLYEKSLGTNPEDKDTDDDGLTDGEEMNTHSSNPLLVDSDGDGHDDKTEAFHGTTLNDSSDFPFLEQDRIGLWYVFKGKAYDMSPARNHGKLKSVSFTKDRFNAGKNAMRFSGDKSTVEAGSYKGVGGAGQRAVSMWVLGEAGQSGGVLYWGSSGKEFALGIGSSGEIVVTAEGGTLAGTTDLMDGLWHHVVVSVPQDGSLDDTAVYVDNSVETITGSGSTGTALNTSSGTTLTIGRDEAGTYLKGLIDDVRVWERSLAASEVDKLYELEKPTAPPEPDVISPKITVHPTHQGAATSGSASFTVEATGKPDPTYAWQKQENRKWKNIPGGTLATFTIDSTALGDATNYRVVVSNSAGSVNSKTARLSVLDPPAFVIQPQDMLFATGSNATLEVDVTGSKTLRYKWYKDGSEIPKATKSRLTIKKVSAARDNGTYQVEVENGAGKMTSDEFNVSIISAVEVTDDPVDASFVMGTEGTLSVTATGGGTITYQWEKFDPKSRKWAAVEGATSATLTVADVQSGTVGEYRCVVDNVASSDYSKGGDLGMYIVPTFKTHPRSYSLNEARKVTLKAFANGDPDPSYQWEKSTDDGASWQEVSKATKSELAFSKVSTNNAGRYRVKAINGGGITTSDEATLIVYFAPRITTQPVASSVNEGDAVNLSVVATSLDSKGTTSTYVWYKDKKAVKDGDGVSGAKTADLSIATAGVVNAGSYYCVIKNSVGSVQTSSAKVTVMLKPYSTKTLKSLSLADGKTATFSASISGGKPVTYQWQKDGADISGQVANKLSLRGVKASDSGIYSIIATNAAGSFTLSADLTVAAAASVAEADDTITELDEESLLSAVEDADGDGMSNLLEYALGSDPANNESTFEPLVDTVEDGSGATYVSFSYTENKSVTDVNYIVERSVDLKNWEPVDLANASVNRVDRGGFTEVTAFIPTTDGSGFLRVSVTNQ